MAQTISVKAKSKKEDQANRLLKEKVSRFDQTIRVQKKYYRKLVWFGETDPITGVGRDPIYSRIYNVLSIINAQQGQSHDFNRGVLACLNFLETIVTPKWSHFDDGNPEDDIARWEAFEKFPDYKVSKEDLLESLSVVINPD